MSAGFSLSWKPSLVLELKLKYSKVINIIIKTKYFILNIIK